MPAAKCRARHRPMQNPYTRPAMFALELLHAEVGGAILENRQKNDEMSEQMRQMEAFIKMLGEAAEAEQVVQAGHVKDRRRCVGRAWRARLQ